MRELFPLQWLAALIPGQDRRLRALRRLIGKQERGADAYRYYEDYLARQDPGVWEPEYAQFRAKMAGAGVTLSGRHLLDVSGEPGLFAAQAQRDGAASVTVTAFAGNVVAAIRKHLALNAVEFDFNADRLSEVLPGTHDFIVCRYALGYCEDLPRFFAELRAISAPGAYVFLSFSPPSLGLCSRWMFEDYSYLRQYTPEHVLVAAARHGFRCEQVFDEGSYRFDRSLHFVQRALTAVYRHVLARDLLSGSDYYTQYQHNVGLLLRLECAPQTR
jgi:SAM-dependent methyltransferase